MSDTISEHILGRIWEPELAGQLAQQGPWVQEVKTSFSIQRVVSMAVVEDRLAIAVSTVDWSPGTPVIQTQMTKIDMGAVAVAADDWREDQ